ncbi:hypothetical protein QEW_4699 [Clostridioides difficile CD160]|nr:hypothetical protein QEW_4699 [Clostridioides difficile CD160]
MFNPRTVLVALVINYLLLIVISSIYDVSKAGQNAKELQMLIKTAADMSLEQTQVTDDFFVNSSINTNLKPYKMNFPSQDGTFKTLSLYDAIYNKKEEIPDNRNEIFLQLYDNKEFRDFSQKCGNVRIPIQYWNTSKTGLLWYTMPKIAEIGTNLLPSNVNSKGIKYENSYVNASVEEDVYEEYGFDTHKKQNDINEYYITPISLGITYLNKDFLGTLFMNNMDLLMRTKYDKSNWNLNSEKGGNGIYKGEYYKDTIKNTLEEENPINNGVFTLLRGKESTEGNPTVKTFKGITPKIEYKVIDMYDSKNDVLLTDLFGAKKTTDEGRYFNSKADYLKDLDKENLNPMTNQPFESKPIVVAKVTFYADVIIPYSSITSKEMRSKNGNVENNFLDIVRENTTGIKGKTGSDVFSYTRYFAVTP